MSPSNMLSLNLTCHISPATMIMASKEDVLSPDSREYGRHYGAKRQALDLPTRWSGLHSARVARQFRCPASWEHGCVDDIPVRAQGTLVVLLRLNGNAGSVIGGFVTYRLARKGGKEALA